MRKKGFTLAEVLIVVVIIAILAGLSTNLYIKTVEKSRWSEAYQVLGQIRAAMLRYYYEKGEPDLVGISPNLDWSDLYIDEPEGNYFGFSMGPTDDHPDVIAHAQRKKNVPWLGGNYFIGIAKNGELYSP